MADRRTFIRDTSFVLGGAHIIGITACKSQPTKAGRAVDPEELVEITISDIHEAYKASTYTCESLVKAFLDRIESIDRSGPAINSIIEVNPDALAIAIEIDKTLSAEGIHKPLLGIPVLLKDNIDTHDKMSTTAGSRALAGSKPLTDSAVAANLREAGAVILGKTNLSEWANFRGQSSTSGWSGLGGLTKNPYVLDRNTCGSSAGSGAAVAANLCVMAIGTETNGSIVCPSSTNGVVGIKPTVGLVSRRGIIPISSTQDTAGPMARSVTDAVISLGALIGPEKGDPTTMDYPSSVTTDFTSFLNLEGLKGKRLAYYTAPRGREEEVDKLMDRAISDMKNAGAEVIEVDKISEDHVGPDSFQIMLYEYKEGLNNYFASLGANSPIKQLEDLIAFNKTDSLELKYFGQQYLEMALEKDGLDSDDYKETLERMLKGRRELGIDRVMDEMNLDAFIAPTGSPAWVTRLDGGDTFKLGSSSPAAQSGYPNICVPMGYVGELPVGLSIFGRAWSEGTLIEIAYAYEQITKHRRSPKYIPSI